MKLYTEEQVIEFTMAMISQYEFGNKNIHNRELLRESLDNKKPIELPSDEEIEDSAKNEYNLSIEEMCRFKEGIEYLLKFINKQK